MQTMNQSLAALFQRRLITLEDALGRSSDAEELRNLMASGAAGSPSSRRVMGAA
jgi:twitching motility protein PilT